MSIEGIRALLSKVRSLGARPRFYVHRGEPTPFALTCAVEAPVPWDAEAYEESLEGRLPDDLRLLWQEAGGMRLFEDQEHGQWGLILWPPQLAMERTIDERSGRPDEYEGGDLVIGEFLGDAERLVVRCSPSAEDYGRVYIALPIDPRVEWESPAASLSAFLALYLDAHGDKFWELAVNR